MSTELERARQGVDSFMHIVKDCDCDDCIGKRDKRADFERLVREETMEACARWLVEHEHVSPATAGIMRRSLLSQPAQEDKHE